MTKKSLDIREKAIEILENLANSLHDRKYYFDRPVFFNRGEVKILENALNSLVKDKK